MVMSLPRRPSGAARVAKILEALVAQDAHHYIRIIARWYGCAPEPAMHSVPSLALSINTASDIWLILANAIHLM